MRRACTIAYLRREDGAHEIVTLGARHPRAVQRRLGAPGFPRGERLQQLIEAAVARRPRVAGAVAAARDRARRSRTRRARRHAAVASAARARARAHRDLHPQRALRHALGVARRARTAVASPRISQPMARRARRRSPIAWRCSSDRKRTLVVAGLIVRDGRVLDHAARPRRRSSRSSRSSGSSRVARSSPARRRSPRWSASCARRSASTVTVGRIWDVLFHAYPEFDLVMLVYACTIVDGRAARRRGPRPRLGAAPARARRVGHPRRPTAPSSRDC